MKCLNPECKKEAEGKTFCSFLCQRAVAGDSPEGRRVRHRPMPPAQPDAGSPERSRREAPSVVAKPVAGIPTTETHPNGEAKSIPLWMDKEKAMRTPLILPKDMTQAELLERLRKARDYNSYQRSLGQPHHCTSEPQWKLWLVRSSYDHRLSRHVFPSSL